MMMEEAGTALWSGSTASGREYPQKEDFLNRDTDICIIGNKVERSLVDELLIPFKILFRFLVANSNSSNYSS